MSRIYRPTYTDKKTGKTRESEFWYADYTGPNGKRVRRKAAKDRDAAKDLLKVWEAEAVRQRHGIIPKVTNDVSIDQVVAQFEVFLGSQRRQNTIISYAQSFKTLFAWFKRHGIRQVSNITVPRIEAYQRDRQAAGLMASSINLETQKLKTMLTWASEPGRGLIASNPIAVLKPLKKSRDTQSRKRRALKPSEVEKLMARAQQPYRDVWALYLGTGLRKMELANATVGEVDLEAGRWVVPAEKCKTGEDTFVRLSAATTTILERLIPRGAPASRFLFWPEVSSAEARRRLGDRLADRLQRDCQHAGIDTDRVSLHSLRKTFVTDLIRAGVNIRAVQRLARHKRIEMTLAIYTEVFPFDEAAAIEQLSYGDALSDGKVLASVKQAAPQTQTG